MGKKLNLTCVCGNGLFTIGKEYTAIKNDGMLIIEEFEIYDFEIDYQIGKIVIPTYSITGEVHLKESPRDKDIEFKINYGSNIEKTSKDEGKTNNLLTLVPYFSRKALKDLNGLLKISFADDDYMEYLDCYGVLVGVSENCVAIDIKIVEGLDNVKELICYDDLDEEDNVYTISANEVYRKNVKIEKINIFETINQNEESTIHLNQSDLDNLLNNILDYFSKGYVTYNLAGKLSSRNMTYLLHAITYVYNNVELQNDGMTIVRSI